MMRSDLLDILVQERKRYNLLNEVFDLSRQLAEAVDRQDQVTVQMLLSMRQEPINSLELVLRAQESKLGSLPPQEAARLGSLLDGAPPEVPEEEPLAGQVANNRKLLERTVELDQRINRKLTGPESVYETRRTTAKVPS